MTQPPSSQNPSRRRGIPVIVWVAAAVLLSTALLYLTVGRPYFTYEKASSMLETGEFDLSTDLFLSLGNYRDAARQAQQAQLAKANWLCQQERFDEALDVLDGLSLPEEELTVRQDAIEYARGQYYLDNKRYDEALAVFTMLGDYSDATDQAQIAANRRVIAQAEAAVASHDYSYAISLLSALGKFENAQQLMQTYETDHLTYLAAQREQAQNLLACGAWYTLLGGNAPALCGNELTHGGALPQGKVFGGIFNALVVSPTGKTFCLGTALGDRSSIESWQGIVDAAGGWNHLLAVTGEGNVLCAGDNLQNQLDISSWNDIIQVAAGAYHSIGLRADGTVLSAGLNESGQCDVASWRDIQAVDAGLNHTVGLCADGTVVASGDDSFGQCDVEQWQDIVAIACGGNHTLGLKADGTMVATGDNVALQCEVSQWQDIIAIEGGMWHSVGLRADGRVVASGTNANGQCQTDGWKAFDDTPDFTAQPPQNRSDAQVEFSSNIMAENGPWLYLSSEMGVKVAPDPITHHKSLTSDLHVALGVLPTNVFAYQDESGRRTAKPAVIARQNGVVFGQTGDYISYMGNPKGVMIRNGKVYFDKDDAPTMAFLKDGTLRVYAAGTVTADELLAQGVKNSWAFGPILVEYGQVTDGLENHRLNRRNYRSAIGMVEPFHFVSIVTDGEGSPTLVDLADKFIQRKCVTAYNLDGGNSSGLVLMGEQLNRHAYNAERNLGQRAMPDMFALGYSDLIPGEDEPYERILHVPVGDAS